MSFTTLEDRVRAFEMTISECSSQNRAQGEMPVAAQNTPLIPPEVMQNFGQGIENLKGNYFTDQAGSTAHLAEPADQESSGTVLPRSSPCPQCPCKDYLVRFDEKLEAIHAAVSGGKLNEGRTAFTTEEFIAELKKRGTTRTVETIRRLCRERGIRAKKRSRGRGEASEWMIPVAELNRYLDEGPSITKQ